MVLVVFLFFIGFVAKPKSDRQETKLYHHDPFELSAKHIARNPKLFKLANQAVSVEIIASPASLNRLLAYYRQTYPDS